MYKKNKLYEKYIFFLNYIIILLLFYPVLHGCKTESSANKAIYSKVNPFIGTGGHGHTFPGATLPFGMVQLSPDTRLEGWDGCSGYHYSDSIIYGFSHTHLSGTGVGDYGDILIMPTISEVKFDNGYKTGVENGYASKFIKSSELATPGYYSVHLLENDIDVELTATKRTGIHKYIFNKGDTANLIFDLDHRDRVIDCNIRIINDSTIEGFRISQSWAQEQHVYFVAEFSKAFSKNISQNEKLVKNGIIINENRTHKIALRFKIQQGDILMVKVGISAVDLEGARKNLQLEAPHWDFNQYKNQAQQSWEKSLNKIQIKGGTEDQKSIFYTALYHSMIAPNLFSDVDERYRGTDLKIHESKDGQTYTVFSLWDTFRATHPLFTIIEQKKTNEFIRTFLKHYKNGGQLPIWELAANYTGCMIGYHSIPVITDAFIKNIRDYDTDLALKAMIKSANKDHLGLDAYKKNGFIALTDESESVSKTLEYAYDDWCIAVMAKYLGENEISASFFQRAQYYKNIFDPQAGFMRAKLNGGWDEDFDPTEVNLNFTEANSWQYSMFVPQDISGLINLHGGVINFENKLDELFTTTDRLSGRHQSDITGLIGQYAHGNEPSHHMAYLYNYVGKPWKTQERVQQILNELYQNTPDGLSGNEDCGQMSSWYVLSAMGIYAVTPGEDYYTIGTPIFKESKINLENGNVFTIKAKHLTAKNKYIQSAKLNGKEFNQSYLMHHTIMNGGELVFEMGSKPNKNWGLNMLVPSITENEILPVPYLNTSKRTFKDSLEITIESVYKNCNIYYKLNTMSDFKLYNNPLTITSTDQLEAYSEMGDLKSHIIKSNYTKINDNRKIALLEKYDHQYTAGGDNALIDHLRGGTDYRTDKCWQGYQGKNMLAIIDLGTIENIRSVSLGCLQNIGSWIWYPKEVRIWVSTDNKNFTAVSTIKNIFPTNEYGEFTQELSKNFNPEITGRYIKIEATNFGVCPEWHLGAGSDTWIFVDEITIESY